MRRLPKLIFLNVYVSIYIKKNFRPPDCNPGYAHVVSGCFFLPLSRGQAIDLLEATGEVPKCQTQLAAPAPYGDLDLQSMEPPKTTLQAKYQHSLG